jgi:LysM repeat protein
MEPAVAYCLCLSGVLGVWLAGERCWTAARALLDIGSGRGRISRFTVVLVGVGIAVASFRLAPATAAVVPMHERVIVDDATLIESIDDGSAASRHLLFGEVAFSKNKVNARPSTHTVVSGDCLWKIARSLLMADGEVPSGAAIGVLWREIYALNRDVIGSNPNLIFPGQVLVLPER